MTAGLTPAEARVYSNSVMSRAWALRVNGLAASNLVSRPLRSRIYRRAGLEVETDEIFPRCYFHTCDVWIGPDALVNYGCHIENVARVVIGARTSLGMFVRILTSTHELGSSARRAAAWVRRPVTVGAGCWLGAGSLVLPGVTIGDGCVIAAGAVVREDCAPHGLYGGVPARRLRDLDEDGPPR